MLAEDKQLSILHLWRINHWINFSLSCGLNLLLFWYFIWSTLQQTLSVSLLLLPEVEIGSIWINKSFIIDLTNTSIDFLQPQVCAKQQHSIYLKKSCEVGEIYTKKNHLVCHIKSILGLVLWRAESANMYFIDAKSENFLIWPTEKWNNCFSNVV